MYRACWGKKEVEGISKLRYFTERKSGKMRKRIIVKKVYNWIIILAIVVVLMPCKNIYAETSVSKEEKIRVILETGAPEDFVKELSDYQINDYYTKFSGKNIIYKGTESKIVEVKDEGDKQTKGTISKSLLQLSISVFEDMDDYGAGEIYGLIVGANYKWLDFPKCAFTDAMTVNWDASLFNFQSFYAESGHYVQEQWFSSDKTNTPASLSSGGVGWFLDIAFGYLEQGGGSIYLVPKNTLHTWDNLNMQISFTYAHEIVSGSLSLGVGSDPSGSAGVSIAGGSYDSQAIATIYR